MADPLIGALRASLARAQAGVHALREQAQARLDAVAERHQKIRRSAAEVPRRAGEARARRLGEIATRYADRLNDLAGRAAEAAAREAPGPAGGSWVGWRADPMPRGTLPGPYRVGVTAIEHAPAVPVLVPLLDLAHVWVSGEDRTECDAVVASLLLRALGSTTPGSVRIHGYDPEHLGGALAGFAPLAKAGLLTFVGPRGLTGLLDELVDHVRRINETVLAGSYRSLRELAIAQTGRRPEPWRIVVLLGGGRPDELTRHEHEQLVRLARTGVACGVHLIVRGMPPPDLPTVRHVEVGHFEGLPFVVEPPPPELITACCREVAERVAVGPPPAAFVDLLPGELWTRSAAAGLTTPVGEGLDGRMVEVTLADYPPHALIAGPSGTGKTNLIYAWLAGLTSRYSPDELELYLLDFKEGVSFARFAPGQRDPSWLPHVRLVGINVNTDREFGVALLRFLGSELRDRAEAAKRYEVTTLAELRVEEPAGRWPRIVAVIDEFQILLAGRDALATEAVTLLEDLARRGRSQGIHLILASQDVSGIEALWGRHGLIGQFALRIALPKARRILAEANTAADTVPRHHAVINDDAGAVTANRVARIPPASDRRSWGELQHRLWLRRPPRYGPPRLFDGAAVPDLTRAPDFQALGPKAGGPAEPVALLGESINVGRQAAAFRLPRAPGRNLAVLGTRLEEACAVLDAAGRSLARQYPPGTGRFSVACLDVDARASARALFADLPPDSGWYEPEDFGDLLTDADERDRTHFLFIYAVDAARARMNPRDDRLRRLLHGGPERHVHVLGWWRGVGRLRDDLGGPAGRTDAIGGWVALDVHGGDLTPLYPADRGPTWYPRPWRGLYFDRARHRTAEVLIPYGPAR